MAQTGQQVRIRTAKAVAASRTPAVRAATTRRSSWGDRLRYRFDNSMSGGTPALVGWLSVVTGLMIAGFAGVLALTGLGPQDTRRNFVEDLFYNLLHALDPGTIGGDSGSWPFLLTMLLLTLGGLFVVSALIGVLATGIDAKLADLRRGRSLVLESDHTVILGWSNSVFTILNELTLANESRRDPVVVVLADRDKVEMEEELKLKVPERRGTRIVCRSGSPSDIDDLRLSSHGTARSVILLAPPSEDPDSEVIKTLLALTHERAGNARIVAEIQNPSNLEVARLVGAGRTTLLDIRETVAKLVVQTSRQSGAAAVYIDLFDYDGDEFYFLEQHGLDGTTYGDAQQAFESASVVGLIDAAGRSKLNPAPSTVITAIDTLIVVAEDDSALDVDARSHTAPDLTRLGHQPSQARQPTRALVIGWNHRAPIMLRELARYAPSGSSVTVLTAFGDPVVPDLPGLDVTVVNASTTDRTVLEAHVVADLDQILVLCYDEHLDIQAADSRTLVTLLHVRDLLRHHGVETPVVSEMIDDRNRVLAQVADVDDVVVSGEIVSLLVTQLSEDGRLEAVFGELLGSDGSEIYLRPAAWYVQPGEVSWASVVAGAVARGETAIGLKSPTLAEPGQRFGVTLNPAKSQRFTIGADDCIVVLAED